jgi:hypothetical protein
MPIIDTNYFVILPGFAGNFDNEWNDCLTRLLAATTNNHRYVFKLNVFIDADNETDLKQKQQHITDTILFAFGEKSPPFGVFAQKPEKPFHVVIEAGLINTSDAGIDYRKFENWQYAILKLPGYKELWAIGMGSSLAEENTETAAKAAFEAMYEILLKEQMTFNHIIRQWNYIGKILHYDPHNSQSIQHYQLFNEVRHNYYRNHRKVPGFPAATGIGMKFDGVMIDCCAVATDKDNDIQVISIKNPKQVNAHAYGQDVLKGSPIYDKKEKQPPKFERAKLLVQNNKSRLFVSGTASIIGQDTVGIGDVNLQTRITIENIETLISRDNLLLYCPQLKAFPDKYCYIRVYVKHANHIPVVKSICKTHFGNIPASYIEADICRDELLVEIEAEKHS